MKQAHWMKTLSNKKRDLWLKTPKGQKIGPLDKDTITQKTSSVKKRNLKLYGHLIRANNLYTAIL